MKIINIINESITYKDVYDDTLDNGIIEETRNLEKVLRYLGAEQLDDIIIKYDTVSGDNWLLKEFKRNVQININSNIYDKVVLTKYKNTRVAIFLGSPNLFGYVLDKKKIKNQPKHFTYFDMYKRITGRTNFKYESDNIKPVLNFLSANSIRDIEIKYSSSWGDAWLFDAFNMNRSLKLRSNLYKSAVLLNKNKEKIAILHNGIDMHGYILSGNADEMITYLDIFNSMSNTSVRDEQRALKRILKFLNVKDLSELKLKYDTRSGDDWLFNEFEEGNKFRVKSQIYDIAVLTTHEGQRVAILYGAPDFFGYIS